MSTSLVMFGMWFCGWCQKICESTFSPSTHSTIQCGKNIDHFECAEIIFRLLQNGLAFWKVNDVFWCVKLTARDWRTGAQYQNEVSSPSNVLGFVEATVTPSCRLDQQWSHSKSVEKPNSIHCQIIIWQKKPILLTKCPLSQSRCWLVYICSNAVRKDWNECSQTVNKNQ